MKIGKWLKGLLWASGSFVLLCAVGFFTLFMIFTPPRAFMLVENRTTIPITVVHLSYSGKTLARNLLIEAGHASEFFCMWPRTEAEIIVELMRHDESEASRHTFFAKQKIYQHRDFPVAVTERSTFLRKVGFMEGVDHSNCVWID